VRGQVLNLHDVLDFVREKRAEQAQKLAIGSAQSFDDYRFVCGYIKALDDIETDIVERTTVRGDSFIER
jgi:hypothetical protein